jgi:hypothetical protein
VLLAGQELGLDPFASLRSITIIKGTVTLYAMAARGLLLREGHEIVFRDSTDHRCVVDSKRRGTDNWQRFEWNLDRARKAGLYPGDSRGNWARNPKAMLMARASSEGARYVAPDALLGMPAIYEELADTDAEVVANMAALEASVPDGSGTAPAAAKAQRKRQPARAALPPAPADSRTDPPPAPAPEIPPITVPLRNRMFGLLRQLGKGDKEQRDEALALIGGMLEPPRKLESTSGLNSAEAQAIISQLEGLVQVASADQSEHGEEGHEPLSSNAADVGDPKSDWPEGTAGEAANE